MLPEVERHAVFPLGVRRRDVAVRRALGDDSDRYLISSADALGLAGASQGVLVDHEQFEALVDEGGLHAALELCRGPLLQGLDAEWIRLARTEHVDRLSDVLGRRAREAEDAGSLEQAIRYTRRQVALSPLAEPPNRELIRRLTAAGDRASALIVYGELAERFRRELQAVPSLATRAMAALSVRTSMGLTRCSVKPEFRLMPMSSADPKPLTAMPGVGF